MHTRTLMHAQPLARTQTPTRAHACGEGGGEGVLPKAESCRRSIPIPTLSFRKRFGFWLLSADAATAAATTTSTTTTAATTTPTATTAATTATTTAATSRWCCFRF